MSRKALAWMAFADVAVLWIVMWLVIRHVVAERPTLFATFPILLVSNFLIIRRSAKGQLPPRRPRVPVLAWIGLGLYTVSALFWVGTFVIHPSREAGVGALLAASLAALFWWLMLKWRGMLERHRKGDVPSE